MLNQKNREELISLINDLPEKEVITAKRFLEFLITQAKIPFQSEREKEKIKLAEELCGICAGVPGGSEEFMKEKHQEIEEEERRYEERLK